ncbi:MAG TPA: MmgE/PrpD family protein [Pirellulaceae bacterium]|nr:MmgE/PrpD family protein [Pirellulaceae bacterium]
MSNTYLTLKRTENQARGIGQYAIDFLAGGLGLPSETVLSRVEQFHLDSIACGVAALAIGANAPRVLRDEALEYRSADGAAGATLLGSRVRVFPEKAVLANSAAVRELDANGTNFGYNPRTGYCRGEFGHNDFYPVALAAAQQAGWDGRQTLLAMLCLDEIRGRLAEVFGLKDHKIDHVLHGAIASAAVYGAVLGATAEQIQSAIGLTVAHYVPFRAIRHGEQLSDSKGASAAISAEVAVTSMRRAMRGFVGPADIFRNPQAVFCLFEPPHQPLTSPFDLELATGGDDFAVMGMHFKLGLYEHQSAGAIAGLIDLLEKHPELLTDESTIDRIRITIYEPAYSIIGDPHKRNPTTRQSADHSMVYIIATLLRKAIQLKQAGWKELMLVPADYDDAALFDPLTRRLMERIEFVHGGAEYDAKYPDGIPTTVEISRSRLPDGTSASPQVSASSGPARQAGPSLSSGLVMYPAGHARNTSGNLDDLLAHKFRMLASLGVRDVDALYRRFTNFATKTADEIRNLYDFEILNVRSA